MGRYGLALEESRRLLERQEAALDDLRARGTNLLAVAAVVAGLLGKDALAAKHHSAATYVALGLFGLTAFVAVLVLLPRTWEFSHDVTLFVSDIDLGKDEDLIERDMALHLQGFRGNNATKLAHIAVAYTVSCLLLGLQVVAWAVSLMT